MKSLCLAALLGVCGVMAGALAAVEEPRIDLKVAPGELLAVPSFEACSFYFRVGDTAARAPFAVEFRAAGDAAWRRAFSPVSDQPAGIWKGSLFNLEENRAWQVRVVDASGAEVIAPVEFHTWTSAPRIAKTIDLSTLPGAERGLVVTDQGTPDGWIKYTAPRGWKLERPSDPADGQPGAITVRNARYVIFENLTVAGGARHGISIEDSESVRVLNCDISGWGRVGVQQYTNDEKRGKYADASGALINLDGGVAIQRSRNTVVERNYLHDPRGRANSWQYSHPTGPTAVLVHTTGGGNVVRWNDFVGSDEHRWNDVIESASNRSPTGGFYRDSDISGNFLAFGNDDGTELEGGGMNVRFYRNKIEGTLCGVSTGPSLLGPQFIFENLFVNLGDETGLALMFFKNSHALPQSGKRHHLNNTLYGVASIYGGYSKPAGDERLGFMRNNVFVANAARLPGEQARRDDFDGDQFWIDGNREASGAFLAGWRQIGQEASGVVAEPGFVDAAAGDFHLSRTSGGRDAALPVANLVEEGGHRGALIEDTSEVPFRPLALQAVPRQLNFPVAQTSAHTVTLTLPASATTPMPFEIRQNAVFTWFRVMPATGTVRPGESVTLSVSIDETKLRGRPLFKGAFLVRTPSGLSRPVSVYAHAKFSEELRPVAVSNSAFIEAAALPEAAALVRTTPEPGVFGERYVEFSGEGREPVLRATFTVPKTGNYHLMLRTAIAGEVMKARRLEVSLDGKPPEPTKIDADYQWNTGATHFRAVYVHALGELAAGRHELQLSVKDALKLNEIIITETPAPFLADGRHEATR